MLIIEKYLTLPILYLYWLKIIAVAAHISKNEDRETASNTTAKNSAKGIPPKLVTYELTGYGVTSWIGALERYESRYRREITRLMDAKENDTVYNIIA